ncbi:MAG: S8 family serine peptidase, partial [Oceanococcus sp.]
MKGISQIFTAAVLAAACGSASAGLLGNVLKSPAKEAYIVQFDAERLGLQNVSALTSSVLAGIGADAAFYEYDTVLQGFAAALTDRQRRLLQRNPLIASIEKDRLIQVGATQSNPVWGLDRIDEVANPRDSSYDYVDSAGENVHVYVIDTGLNPDHQEFTGRVGNGRNFVNDGPAGLGGLLPVDLLGILLGGGGDIDPDAWQDCHGHGTHVTGTAAGTQYGVAKKATVHGVRVLNCGGSGSGSGVIAGIEWVAENAQYPAVVNLSLGGGASDAEDQAIANLFNANVLPVVAAGNDNADACSSSPARAPEAITVASSAENDTESSFSNHGTCVDIFAPGSNVVSADYNNNTGSTTMSGTSMASP